MDFDQVSAGQYGVQLSITLLTAVVVGGVATLFGPAVGAFAIVYVSELFPKEHPEFAPALFGVTLIVLMMVAPGGIVGLTKQGWAWLRRSRSIERHSAAASGSP
jgi:ABC-type branched-subunit amino acid transport system permease subunit